MTVKKKKKKPKYEKKVKVSGSFTELIKASVKPVSKKANS